MSLLHNEIKTPELTNAELIQKMKQVLETPFQMLKFLYTLWSDSFEALHGDPATRPQKLQILGTNAVELFQLNAALTQFMLSQLTGKRDDLAAEINARLATLPQFNFNPDGTVTEVNPDPTQSPTE
jgi:hypothetical protein